MVKIEIQKLAFQQKQRHRRHGKSRNATRVQVLDKSTQKQKFLSERKKLRYEDFTNRSQFTGLGHVKTVRRSKQFQNAVGRFKPYTAPQVFSGTVRNSRPYIYGKTQRRSAVGYSALNSFISEGKDFGKVSNKRQNIFYLNKTVATGGKHVMRPPQRNTCQYFEKHTVGQHRFKNQKVRRVISLKQPYRRQGSILNGLNNTLHLTENFVKRKLYPSNYLNRSAFSNIIPRHMLSLKVPGGADNSVLSRRPIIPHGRRRGKGYVWRINKKPLRRRKRYKRLRYMRLLFKRLFWYPAKKRHKARFFIAAKRVRKLRRGLKRPRRKFGIFDYLRYNKRKFRFRSRITLRYYWMSRYKLWTQRKAYLRTLHFKTARYGLLRFMQQEEMNLKRFVITWGLIPRRYRYAVKTDIAIMNGLVWVNFKPVRSPFYILKPGDCVFVLLSRLRKFFFRYRSFGFKTRLTPKYLKLFSVILWRWFRRKKVASRSKFIRHRWFKGSWREIIYFRALRLLTTKYRTGYAGLEPRKLHRRNPILYMNNVSGNFGRNRFSWRSRFDALSADNFKAVLRAKLFIGYKVSSRYRQQWLRRSFNRRLAMKYHLSCHGSRKRRVLYWSSHMLRYHYFVEASRRLKIIVIIGKYTWAIHILSLYMKQLFILANYHVQNWFMNTRFF